MASVLCTAKLMFQPQKVCHFVLQKCTIFLQLLPAAKDPFSKKLGVWKSAPFFSLSHALKSSCFSNKVCSTSCCKNVSFLCNFCQQPKLLFQSSFVHGKVHQFSHFLMASLWHTAMLLFQQQKVCHFVLQTCAIFLQLLAAAQVPFSKQLGAQKNVSFFSLSDGFSAVHCKAPVSATKSLPLCAAKMCHFSATVASSQNSFFKAGWCMEKCVIFLSFSCTAKLLFQPQNVFCFLLQKCVIFLQLLPAAKAPFSKQLCAQNSASIFSLSHGFTAAHCSAPVPATKNVPLHHASKHDFSSTFGSSPNPFFKAAWCMKKCVSFSLLFHGFTAAHSKAPVSAT